MKNNWVKLAGIASELTALIIAAVLIGQYIDRKMGSAGIATVTLIILAFCGWFIRLIKVLNKQNLEETSEGSSSESAKKNADDSLNKSSRPGNDA